MIIYLYKRTNFKTKRGGFMKNFSGITDNLDITTKKYVDDGLAGKANLAGNNTFKGKQTLIDAPEDGYSIDASGYIKGSWLQSDVKSNYGSGTGMVCVFDGRGWIYYRTPAEILAEAGGAKASDIPPAVTESTVSGWGFTKNTGTVTDVKMNGTSKVTNGVADLGTVLTDAGGTFTGPVSSKSYYKSENADLRTSTTLSHIAVKVDNGRTNSHTAYMNGQINIKSASSSSEKTITIPDKAGTLALTSDIPTIPDVSGKADLSGTNNFTGSNTFTDNNVAFIGQNGQTSINGSNVSIQAVGAMGSAEFSVKTDNNNKVFEVISDADNGAIHLNRVINIDNEQQGNVPLCIGGTNAGASGQVLTSQGTGETPTWTTLPITSATLDVANKTLYLTLPSGS